LIIFVLLVIFIFKFRYYWYLCKSFVISHNIVIRCSCQITWVFENQLCNYTTVTLLKMFISTTQNMVK